MQQQLIERAKELLESGAVARVVGWKVGDFCYDITPATFNNTKELESGFVYNELCQPNLSKYLIAQSKKPGKTLVFLKPCDTYSTNQLLKEHRMKRENLYIVAVPCEGKLDTNTIKSQIPDGICDIRCDGDMVLVETFSGTVSLLKEQAMNDRCKHCKGKTHVLFDEKIGNDADYTAPSRFEEVERLEAMTCDERFAFWQNELSRCIRCNACRNVCPACTCEKCVFDNEQSGAFNKAAANSFEEQMFHIIRAFHVAGRCTDCGECSRVCPQNIPLHLLNRKFIKDINAFYGDYQAGESIDVRAPLNTYRIDDCEPSSAVEERGNG